MLSEILLDPSYYVAMSPGVELDRPRKRLLELAEASGTDLKALSLAIGRNHSYLFQYVRKGSPRKLDENDRREIARIIGCSEDELSDTPNRRAIKTRTGHTQRGIAGGSDFQLPYVSGPQGRLGGPRDLKRLGHSKAGVDGLFLDQGEVQGMEERPPFLLGVKDAFCIYVHGDSMVPVLEPGWLLYVDPSRPVRPGNLVILEMTDGQAFVKKLLRRTEKHVICQQYGPLEEVKYPTKDVAKIHRVVGTNMGDS